ncbi:MAG: hypothetical protein QRY74_05115 [Chlamydia sp.]
MHDMATKAIYNNISFHSQNPSERNLDSTAAYQEWMFRNWRIIPLEMLFRELNDLGIHLDKSLFLSWAYDSDSPEDLLLLLAPEESEELEEENQDDLDHIYLILFELWRRFLPERRSISIVADDIDCAIVEYNALDIEIHDPIRATFIQRVIGLIAEYVRALQLGLDHIQEHANDETDKAIQEAGVSSIGHAIFSMTQPFFVHEIGRFIFDFILEELNEDTQHEMRLVVDGLRSFIIPPSWGVCMEAHILAYENEERAVSIAKEVLKQIFPQSHRQKRSGYIDTPAALSILLLAAKIGNNMLFQIAIRNILEHVTPLESEDLFEIVSIASLYTEVVEHPLLSQVSALLDEIEAPHHECSIPLSEYSAIEHFSRTILRKFIE